MNGLIRILYTLYTYTTYINIYFFALKALNDFSNSNYSKNSDNKYIFAFGSKGFYLINENQPSKM